MSLIKEIVEDIVIYIGDGIDNKKKRDGRDITVRKYHILVLAIRNCRDNRDGRDRTDAYYRYFIHTLCFKTSHL